MLILALLLLYISREEMDYMVSLAVLGAGVQFVWSALLTLTVEVSPENRGTVSSLFNSFRFFGYALAPVLFAPIYVIMGIGAVQLGGMALALLAIAIICLIREGDRCHYP